MRISKKILRKICKSKLAFCEMNDMNTGMYRKPKNLDGIIQVINIKVLKGITGIQHPAIIF
jgi:hypothetical protein